MPAKTISIHPTTGPLDLRSHPGEIPANGWRMAQNMRVPQKNSLCRMPGWTRLLGADNPNNADIHDQLLSITGHASRKPITFLFEAESTLKTTFLLAGTEDSLYQLNTGTENWRVLSSSIGGFLMAAQSLDTIVLTNDHDSPRYWVFDTPDGDSSLQPIPDLEELGISKVGVVVSFRGVVFYMNIVENGRTFANRIMWSNVNNPLDLIPSNESVAGNLDIESGEAILAAKELGNVLLVYTTRGIWQIALVGGDEVFAASKRYTPEKSSEGVLTYRNTVTSIGASHIYLGQSAIYEYSLFDERPKRIEWLHRASSIIYDEIDKANCYGPVAGYNGDRHEIWISWTPSGQSLPSRALTINTQDPFVSVVDHGFTAFCQFQPRSQEILRNWLLSTCICTPAELTEFFGDFTNEGGYCTAPDAPECLTQPDAFFTTTELVLEDEIVMEDYNAETPSENSLCARLGDLTLADLCVAESQSDQCNADRLFVMASASDYCLKQASDDYYREHCLTFDTCGTYELRGYKSILRSGPQSFKNDDDEKRFEEFIANCSIPVALIPGQMILRVGASKAALDPNVDCGIVWQPQQPRTLECLTAKTEAEHLAANTRPDREFKWPIHWIGQNLYYELTIQNANSSPIDTGAAVCFSKFLLRLTPKPVRY